MPGSRGVDYNLLVALRALLEERNVTRAGDKVNMSQPAMSAALARLREHYGDELLQRTGRSYEPTPLGQQLLPEVIETLEAVSAALDPWATFDPATSHRVFNVSASDYALAVLVEPLLAVIHHRAPAITVQFDPIPVPSTDMLAHLLRRDLMVAAMGFDFPGRRQVVFSDRFVCIVSASNPRLRDGRLSREDLEELPHAAAFGGQLQTPADFVLAEAGITPRVEVSVQGLLALPFAVAGTDLCAFVPERLLDRCPGTLGLAVAEVPIDDPELAEAAYWHPSRQDDPGVDWLRQALREVSDALGLAAGAAPRRCAPPPPPPSHAWYRQSPFLSRGSGPYRRSTPPRAGATGWTAGGPP